MVNVVISQKIPRKLEEMVDSNNTNSFSKTICSICYEDLKPIVEDLQSISICGHVFHELCLQQWFEYCTNAKKQTCPVCKQGCTKKNVGRLYFQSLGDSILSQCQSENPRINRSNGVGDSDCPEIFRTEVKRLESKVSNLNSALDLQKEEVKKLIDELHICKEQLAEETILKNEALRQRQSIQAILQIKSSDLARSTTECANLQEKNKALVKELAAIKLSSDCNLEEEEIVKLASVGHEGTTQDTIDVLRKSLVIHNKNYKELMAKCNSLGRGEARYQRKLEKAKGKMVKLKTRVQELEAAIEAKDIEMLRLTAAKKSYKDVQIVNRSKKTPSVLKHSSLVENGQFSSPVINLDDDEDDSPFNSKKTEKNNTNGSKCLSDRRNILDQETTPSAYLIDECELQKSNVPDTCTSSLRGKEDSHIKCGSANMIHPDYQIGSSMLDSVRNNVVDECSASKDAAGLLLQDIRQIQPSAHSNQEASSFIPLVEPGDRCFAGGLLGPDGANRYLGKWCKRAQDKASTNGSSNGRDSLIAVGADGRAGKVRVLRSSNQTITDATENIISAKRFKPGSKSSSLQTQGCLQIDHFFGKACS